MNAKDGFNSGYSLRRLRSNDLFFGFVYHMLYPHIFVNLGIREDLQHLKIHNIEANVMAASLSELDFPDLKYFSVEFKLSTVGAGCVKSQVDAERNFATNVRTLQTI